MNSEVKQNQTKASQIILLATIPLIVLFIAGEVAGRLLEAYSNYMPRHKVSFASANAYLRTALIPDITYQSGSRTIRVNQYGFRGDEFSIPKAENTFRIFAIGESSTFGWTGVDSHEQAWPGQLQKKLRSAYPDWNIEVINAGVPGYTSVEQRVNYMLRISRLEPDALLIYHGNNDIDWSWVPLVKNNLIYQREVVAPPDTSLVNDLLELSYVYMELRSIVTRLSAAYTENEKHDVPDPAAMDMLENNLNGLVGDGIRDGLKVAIATFAHGLNEQGRADEYTDDERELGVPSIGRWFQYLSIQGARKSYVVYNEMVRRLAQEENIPLNDVADLIPKTTEYRTDWCHFTAKGHKLLADTWLKTIDQAGWFK